MPMMETDAGRTETAPAMVRIALVACADAAAQANASKWLATSGFEVAAVAGIGPALDALSRRRPALVFTDLPMTDERGRALCDAARQAAGNGPAVPLLALSAGARDTRAALEAGAADVIQRPVDWHVAALRADRLVRLAEAESALAGARDEIARMRKAAESTGDERTGRDRFDALTGLPDLDRLE